LDWVYRALNIIQQKVQEVRILGAASLEMRYIAAGFVDVYREVGLYPWDLAAGWAIAREAGAVVTDLDGRSFNIQTGRVLAVGCPSLHRAMKRVLAFIV